MKRRSINNPWWHGTSLWRYCLCGYRTKFSWKLRQHQAKLLGWPCHATEEA
jgi:hypothetical protein